MEVTWWNLSVFAFSSRAVFPSSLKFPLAMMGVSLTSKAQICHPTSVPIAIQWHRGLKARALTGDPASIYGAGFLTSLKSKTLTFLSFPPVTMKLPLGETVNVLMTPYTLMLKNGSVLFQMLSSAHPTDAKSELLEELGINLTLPAQPLCWFSRVCLHTPLTFQSFMSLSAPEDRMYLVSLEMAQERISLVCPPSTKYWVV
jgi:hypothetical protein